jgi:hypothetical protein
MERPKWAKKFIQDVKEGNFDAQEKQRQVEIIDEWVRVDFLIRDSDDFVEAFSRVFKDGITDIKLAAVFCEMCSRMRTPQLHSLIATLSETAKGEAQKDESTSH